MKVWCVRADSGQYAGEFLQKGFVGIGWLPQVNLLTVANRQLLRSLYQATYSHVSSPVVIGQQVGQIARFLWDMRAGDYVVTPDGGGRIFCGIVQLDAYAYFDGNDSCPYRHRKRVVWAKAGIMRRECPPSVQKSLRSVLTVFQVSSQEHPMDWIENAF